MIALFLLSLGERRVDVWGEKHRLGLFLSSFHQLEKITFTTIILQEEFSQDSLSQDDSGLMARWNFDFGLLDELLTQFDASDLFNFKLHILVWIPHSEGETGGKRWEQKMTYLSSHIREKMVCISDRGYPVDVTVSRNDPIY